MTSQPSQPGAGSSGASSQPNLKCPFCSGKRFDFGRDVYAGSDQLLYCRKSPPPGQRPDPKVNLPMKGAVCLDCGYVVMMVSVEKLRAPIRKARQAAGPSPEEEAIQALEKMTLAAGEAAGDEDVSRALGDLRREDDGFGDLNALLDDAELAGRPRPNEEPP